MNGTRTIFSDCGKIYICFFHREQSWLRWFAKKENVNAGDANGLLKLFRKVAFSKKRQWISLSISTKDTALRVVHMEKMT